MAFLGGHDQLRVLCPYVLSQKPFRNTIGEYYTMFQNPCANMTEVAIHRRTNTAILTCWQETLNLQRRILSFSCEIENSQRYSDIFQNKTPALQSNYHSYTTPLECVGGKTRTYFLCAMFRAWCLISDSLKSERSFLKTVAQLDARRRQGAIHHRSFLRAITALSGGKAATNSSYQYTLVATVHVWKFSTFASATVLSSLLRLIR